MSNSDGNEIVNERDIDELFGLCLQALSGRVCKELDAWEGCVSNEQGLIKLKGFVQTNAWNDEFVHDPDVYQFVFGEILEHLNVDQIKHVYTLGSLIMIHSYAIGEHFNHQNRCGDAIVLGKFFRLVRGHWSGINLSISQYLSAVAQFDDHYSTNGFFLFGILKSCSGELFKVSDLFTYWKKNRMEGAIRLWESSHSKKAQNRLYCWDSYYDEHEIESSWKWASYSEH